MWRTVFIFCGGKMNPRPDKKNSGSTKGTDKGGTVGAGGSGGSKKPG